jgi:aminoglycoside 6-adenylyltransferase
MDRVAMLRRIECWAREEENIRVLVITGSTARGATDDLSDLDLELYVTDPARLLEATEWYEAFGDVLVVEALANPWWHPTRLVNYMGIKVDFMIATIGDLATAVYRRPFRVLVDKEDATGHLYVEPKGPQPVPRADEFLECIHWFYAEALMAAKCITRGELWMAKSRDAELKSMLLRMLEWDHRARYGADYETWYLGTHWREWMDSDVQAALIECWAGADAESSATALMHTIDLFVRVSERTAALLSQPTFDHQKVSEEVQHLLALGLW